MDHIVFLTGRLARAPLERVLQGIADAPFTWQVVELGLQVAALMTAEMIERRLKPVPACSRIVVPGRCRGDLAALSQRLGVPVERGPEELKDLPRHFRRAARPVDLSQQATLIFAEIVDAPRLDVPAILARAEVLRAEGADVIDLGCLPETPFDHLDAAIRALKAAGFTVSADSLDPQELLRAGRAGADYLLSLTVDTLWVADQVPSTPVLIPRTPQDEASLDAAIAGMQARGRPFLADAILDPIPFGFTAAIVRYHGLRQRHPQVPILLGVGNLTELTEADTSGINALLLGIGAELQVAAILTTQVSGHARRAVREADWARRIMFAAVQTQSLPKGLSDQLMTVHAKQPFTDTPAEIAATAAAVKDPNFRIQVSEQGLHVYNRDGLRTGAGAFELWPTLGLQHDGGHAFYMGVELAHAEIAWRLGKRYVQDQPLDWGCADPRAAADLNAWCAPGSTLPAARRHGLRAAADGAAGDRGGPGGPGGPDGPAATPATASPAGDEAP